MGATDHGCDRPWVHRNEVKERLRRGESTNDIAMAIGHPGECWLCGTAAGKYWPLVKDHNHKYGTTPRAKIEGFRGFLCGNCNRSILAAIEYGMVAWGRATGNPMDFFTKYKFGMFSPSFQNRVLDYLAE